MSLLSSIWEMFLFFIEWLHFAMSLCWVQTPRTDPFCQNTVAPYFFSFYHHHIFVSSSSPFIFRLTSIFVVFIRCGVSWSEEHVSLDCSECGGYSLQRPCPLCDGRCHTAWKRDLTMVKNSSFFFFYSMFSFVIIPRVNTNTNKWSCIFSLTQAVKQDGSVNAPSVVGLLSKNLWYQLWKN